MKRCHAILVHPRSPSAAVAVAVAVSFAACAGAALLLFAAVLPARAQDPLPAPGDVSPRNQAYGREEAPGELAARLSLASSDSPASADPGAGLAPSAPGSTAPEYYNDIVMQSYEAGNWEIYRAYQVNSSDPRVQRLTWLDSYDGEPSLNRGATQIAFVSNRDGNNEIYRMDGAGGSVVRLTNDRGSDRAPTWSPDGSSIAFVTNRDGNREIYLMDSSGGSLRRSVDIILPVAIYLRGLAAGDHRRALRAEVAEQRIAAANQTAYPVRQPALSEPVI